MDVQPRPKSGKPGEYPAAPFWTRTLQGGRITPLAPPEMQPATSQTTGGVQPSESTAAASPEAAAETARNGLMDRAKEALEKATAKGGPLYYDEKGPDMDRTIQAAATARALQEVKKKPAETDAQHQARVNTAAEEAKKAVGEKKADEDDAAYQARVVKAVAEAKAKVSPQVPAETDGAYQLRLGKRTAEMAEEEKKLRQDCNDLVKSGELKRADNRGLISQDANGKPVNPPRNINSTLHKGLERVSPDLAKEFDGGRRIQVGNNKYTKDDYINSMAPKLFPSLQKSEPTLTMDELKRRLADDFDKNSTLEASENPTAPTAADKSTDKQTEKQLSPEEEELKTLNGFINEAMNFVQMELDNKDWNRAEAARQVWLQCRMSLEAATDGNRVGNIPLKCIYMREALRSFQEYIESNKSAGQTSDAQYGRYSMLKKFLETPGAAHVNMDDLKKYYLSQLQIYGIPWVEDFNALVEAGHFSKAMTAIYSASLIPEATKQAQYLKAVLRFKDAQGRDINNSALVANLLHHPKTIPTFVESTFSQEIKDDAFRKHLERLLPLFAKQADKKGLLPFLQTMFGNARGMLGLVILQSIDGMLDPEHLSAQFERAMQQQQR